jgi:hypothetical protein
MAMTKQRVMAPKNRLSELSFPSMLLFGDISRSLRKVVSTSYSTNEISVFGKHISTLPTLGTKKIWSLKRWQALVTK